MVRRAGSDSNYIVRTKHEDDLTRGEHHKEASLTINMLIAIRLLLKIRNPVV